MQVKNVYSPGQAALASILGGPLAATWFIRHNYQMHGNERAASKTVNIGAFVVIAVLFSLPLLPSGFPSILISLPVIIFTRYFIEQKQFNRQHIDDSEELEYQPVSKVVAVSLACFCINLAMVFALAMFLVAQG